MNLSAPYARCACGVFDSPLFPFHPSDSPSNTQIRPFRGYRFRYRHIHGNMPHVTSIDPRLAIRSSPVCSLAHQIRKCELLSFQPFRDSLFSLWRKRIRQLFCNQFDPHSFAKTGGRVLPSLLGRISFSLTPVFATHPKIALVTPLLATLPKTQGLKSCVCHTYRKWRGWGVVC
jgi:hypothetical protein